MGTAQHKLALGTVQFGLDYGISNPQGQVPVGEVQNILAYCSQQNIKTLDTAAAYGQSEEVLGRYLPQFDFQVISKLPPRCTPTEVPNQFKSSLAKLKVAKLDGYIVHDFATYETHPAIWDEMIKLQTDGLIHKIGFSLYFPEQLEKIFRAELPLQLVQIPFNVFDQRFAYLLPELAARNIEVHARSIFLQGLFFKSASELPDFFAPFHPALRELQSLTQKENIPLTALLLGFVHGYPEISKLVIGVTSVKELKTNLDYVKYLPAMELYRENLRRLAIANENLILPFNWKLND